MYRGNQEPPLQKNHLSSPKAKLASGGLTLSYRRENNLPSPGGEGLQTLTNLVGGDPFPASAKTGRE